MLRQEVKILKEYRFNNAIVRVHGNACRATIEKATIKFLKKIELHKAKKKEQQQNGNIDTSRNI